MKRALIILAIFVAFVRLAVGEETEQLFKLISPRIAVGSEKAVARMITGHFEGASYFAPTDEEILSVLSQSNTPAGKTALIGLWKGSDALTESLEKFETSRFQVFGIRLGSGRCLLVMAGPPPERAEPSAQWLTEIVSLSVYDGGASYWWFLYDLAQKRYISCGRRPAL